MPTTPLLLALFATASCSLAMTSPQRSAIVRPPAIMMSSTSTTSTASSSAERYRVLLLNDSFNMREYVQRVLMMVCDCSEEDAMDVMMRADWGFSAVVGTWEKPIADLIFEGMKSHGLQAIIEKEEEDGDASSSEADLTFM